MIPEDATNSPGPHRGVSRNDDLHVRQTCGGSRERRGWAVLALPLASLGLENIPEYFRGDAETHGQRNAREGKHSQMARGRGASRRRRAWLGLSGVSSK